MSDCNINGVLDICEASTAGDFDVDGDVDLHDFAALIDCLGGADTNPTPTGGVCVSACLSAFDSDDDGDIDLIDWGSFQRSFDGAN